MKIQLYSAFLGLLVAVTPVRAADGDWLLKFPIWEEHRPYHQILGQLAGQPLLYRDSKATNVVESYRCISLSSWGFKSVTFDFLKPSSCQATNESGMRCDCEIKEWLSLTNDVITNRFALNGKIAEELLKQIEVQDIFSQPEISRFEIPDLSSRKPVTVSIDASDIILERWTKLSYMCIMRPGMFATYHEEFIKKYANFCFDSATKLKNERGDGEKENPSP